MERLNDVTTAEAASRGYLTTEEVARQLGLTPVAVRRLAYRRDRRKDRREPFGRLVRGRMYFTRAEVRGLKRRDPGPKSAIDRTKGGSR